METGQMDILHLKKKMHQFDSLDNIYSPDQSAAHLNEIMCAQ